MAVGSVVRVKPDSTVVTSSYQYILTSSLGSFTATGSNIGLSSGCTNRLYNGGTNGNGAVIPATGHALTLSTVGTYTIYVSYTNNQNSQVISGKNFQLIVATVTAQPTNAPIQASSSPTLSPTTITTSTPSALPTSLPSVTPTYMPTVIPTHNPTAAPTFSPNYISPTANPTVSLQPSASPTLAPTSSPSYSMQPTTNPTRAPSASPTKAPTRVPTATPTKVPTANPTAIPSAVPTDQPTAYPTLTPTFEPTFTKLALQAAYYQSQRHSIIGGVVGGMGAFLLLTMVIIPLLQGHNLVSSLKGWGTTAYYIVMLFLGALNMALVMAWATNGTDTDTTFLGVPGWGTNPFAYHPIFGVAALFNGLMLRYMIAHISDVQGEYIFLSDCIHIILFVGVCVSQYSVYSYRNWEDNYKPSMTTFHSWIGFSAYVSIVALALGHLTSRLTLAYNMKSRDIWVYIWTRVSPFISAIAFFLTSIAVCTGVQTQLASQVYIQILQYICICICVIHVCMSVYLIYSMYSMYIYT